MRSCGTTNSLVDFAASSELASARMESAVALRLLTECRRGSAFSFGTTPTEHGLFLPTGARSPTAQTRGSITTKFAPLPAVTCLLFTDTCSALTSHLRNVPVLLPAFPCDFASAVPGTPTATTNSYGSTFPDPLRGPIKHRMPHTSLIRKRYFSSFSLGTLLLCEPRLLC